MGCVKEGEMKRHVLCSTSVFSFSEQHITKLGKIQTYLKVMVNTKRYHYLQKFMFNKRFSFSACILQNLVKIRSYGEYKKVVTTKKIVVLKLRQYDF